MAGVANFTWRNSFAVVKMTPESVYDDFIEWGVNNYDLVVAWTPPRDYRIARNWNFLFGFMDTSLVLIVQPSVIDPQWYDVMFSFLRPFDTFVWIALFGVIVITAYVYALVEKGHEDFSENVMSHGAFFHSLYLTMVLFTGAGGFQPGTIGGKLLNLAFSFLILLTLSAYTANLASLLVVKSSRSAPVQSLEQAAAEGVPVCNCYVSSEQQLNKVPGLQQVSTASSLETLEGVMTGKCPVGIGRQFVWEAQRMTKAGNPTCSLTALPVKVDSESSGFVSMEVNDKCTNRAMQFLDAANLKMHEQHFFRHLSLKYYEKASDNSCPNGGFRADVLSDSLSLSLSSLSGIFILYAMAAVSIMLCRRNKCARKSDSELLPSDVASD